MKTYAQLTPEQQVKARQTRLNALLQMAMEDCTFFPELDVKIAEAGEKASNMLTPWFWGEYIMETCRPEFEEMSKQDAELALYSGRNEFVFDEPVIT